jgi:hypothetical protein
MSNIHKILYLLTQLLHSLGDDAVPTTMLIRLRAISGH